MSSQFVVIEYDQVEITSFGGHPKFMAGEIASASVVRASDQEEAISQQSRPGYYAALALPEGLNPVRAVLGVER